MNTLYQSLMSLFVIIILAFTFYYIEDFRFAKNTDIYEGVILSGWECEGFALCNSEELLAFRFMNNIDFKPIYNQHREPKHCSGVYIKVKGQITGEGYAGLGLTAEKSRKVDIYEILDVKEYDKRPCTTHGGYREITDHLKPITIVKPSRPTPLPEFE